MSSQMEEVEVRYCDICGQRGDDMHYMMKCWRCGKDCCPQHFHLVRVEGGIKSMHTYLCDDDRDLAENEISGIFLAYSVAGPGRH